MISISTHSLCRKLASAANSENPALAACLREYPRLPELLWFLQWQSMQPGSLEGFVSRLLCSQQDEFDTGGATAQKRLPYRLALMCDSSQSDAADNSSDGEVVRQRLPYDLAGLMDDRYARDLGFEWKAPWYCPRLFSVLFDFMDLHAAEIQLQIAQTALTEAVFRELNFVWSKKRPVQLNAESRAGKSEAIKTWCAMYPGRARLVTTPPGHSQRDLLTAIGQAFGLEFTPKTCTQFIKSNVELVLHNCRLMIILDEAHFLLPPPTSRRSTPSRLDWFRANTIDMGLPVAFVTTPQAFNQAVDRYRKFCGYNFDQLFGRIDATIQLPAEMDRGEVAEIVRVHGEATGISEQLQKRIVFHFQLTKEPLSKVAAICYRAQFIAEQRGLPAAVTEADVEQAVAIVLGTKTAARAPMAPPRPVTAPRPAAAPAFTGPARQTSPIETEIPA